MSTVDLSVFVGLPDEILHEIFMDFLYREDLFADDVQYDNIATHCSPFSTRFTYFALAILPASRHFYRIAIRVLWQCVTIRASKDLALIEEQTRVGCFLTGHSMGTLTRRLELQMPRPYNPEQVTDVLGRMNGLRVLVVRNYHLGRGHAFTPPPPHVFQPLTQGVEAVRRVQLDTNLLLPTRRDVSEVLIAKPSIKTFRVSRFDPVDVSPPQWTLPNSSIFTSQLTTLSLGSIDPYDHPIDNPWIGALLSGLADHFTLPELTTVHLFEATNMAIPFLRVHGFALRSLAYAAPNEPPNDDDSCITHCPNLDELVWVIRGWGTITPPEEGHDGVSKVAVYYIKEEDERRSDCIEQLGDAVDAFRDGAWSALEELEVVVRGLNVPSFRDCEWDDELVLEVQTLQWNQGWRAVLDVDALTS